MKGKHSSWVMSNSLGVINAWQPYTLKTMIRALEGEDRLKITGLTSAGRACVKMDVLGAARRIERKMAGCGWSVRDICER